MHPLPQTPFDRWKEPFQRFLAVESAAGVMLLAATAVALVAANSPWGDAWLGFWNNTLAFELGSMRLAHSLAHWVNDALMVIFFFVIGLEIKRELVVGELADPRRRLLPVVAALGGALVPALLHLSLAAGSVHADGWAVPMATDIAFVVGCLALLGRRVPTGLKMLLLSMAIVDDLVAVVVIAVAYTESLQVVWLAVAAGGFVLVAAASRVRSVPIYVLIGIVVWFATLEAGIHPTVAGALLGLMTPARAWLAQGDVESLIVYTRESLAATASPHGRREILGRAALAAREALSPLDRLEVLLHPWAGFVIMPIFALANAGVPLGDANPLAQGSLAVGVALLVGKPVGFLAVSWLAVRTGAASLPDRVGWSVMLGAGLLAGIGFTMALFIASLAHEGSPLAEAKTGILIGSAVSGLLGMLVLARTLPHPPSE